MNSKLGYDVNTCDLHLAVSMLLFAKGRIENANKELLQARTEEAALNNRIYDLVRNYPGAPGQRGAPTFVVHDKGATEKYLLFIDEHQITIERVLSVLEIDLASRVVREEKPAGFVDADPDGGHVDEIRPAAQPEVKSA